MNTQPIYLALYRGRRDGSWYHPKVAAARLCDWLIRTLTKSLYSHCELAVRLSEKNETGAVQYACYSSSIRDGGVRTKPMPLPADKWDLIPVLQSNAYTDTLKHYAATRGQRYDWLGAGGVITHWRDDQHKWFCSEWCAAALGLAKPEHYSPAALAGYLRAALPENGE